MPLFETAKVFCYVRIDNIEVNKVIKSLIRKLRAQSQFD